MNIHPKVIGSGAGSAIGGAIADIFVWMLSLHGVNVPTNVGEDFAIIGGAIGSVAFGWLTPSPTTNTP